MTSAPEASDLLACRATEEEEAFLAATRAEVSIIVPEWACLTKPRHSVSSVQTDDVQTTYFQPISPRNFFFCRFRKKPLATHHVPGDTVGALTAASPRQYEQRVISRTLYNDKARRSLERVQSDSTRLALDLTSKAQNYFYFASLPPVHSRLHFSAYTVEFIDLRSSASTIVLPDVLPY